MLRLRSLPPKVQPLLVRRPLTTKSVSQLYYTRPSTRSSRRILSPPLSSKMHTILDGDWSMTDILRPEFRSVDFSDEAPQMLVATQLRHAWRYDPTTSDTSATSIGEFMRENHRRTPKQRAALPVYPDKEAVHTPWRDEVYTTWNHVFSDVTRFLAEVNAFGHFHPPKHDVFALSFPPADGQETEKTRVLTKTWDTNILLIPAHLEPGVVVRLEMFSQREENGEKKDFERVLGRFSEDNVGQIWYLRKGVEARFFIEGEWDKSSKGLAAVMVHANLCDRQDCGGK